MSKILWAFVGACVVTVGLSAQGDPQGQGGAPTAPDRQPPSTQAPPATPPTTQAPPTSTNAGRANADKKVTISGCIERQPASAAAVTGAPTMPFMLTNASAAGAGAAVATSGAAAGAAKLSYRLDGTESTLTPHVGHKVEITGTVQEQRPAAAAAGSANASAGTLKVDSVKMVSPTCP